ncbi:SREBP regulating gene protein [Nilaparvata lugens]|uniref:SREBP regulating gene protein n=1 Tax=Nilaparvata lugens TaxID=108931 RepID=UPI00193D9863|nr:SREBP regulating gene protein [Nilaparvata lugens]
MWYGILFRFFRRKIVLGIIFGLSLTYCILSFVFEQDVSTYNDSSLKSMQVKKIDDSFLWDPIVEHENETDTSLFSCRNSVQGKLLIVDDRGFICLRSEILSNGCCNSQGDEVIERYSCKTCKENGCCQVYEHCVSCCLHPDKRALLQNMLGKAGDTLHILLATVTDRFELCLAKCRTSSSSVEHENSYRDPLAKHCYGEIPPTSSDNQVIL